MGYCPGREGEAETHGVLMRITEQRERDTRKTRTESDSSNDGAKSESRLEMRPNQTRSRVSAEKGSLTGKAMGNPWGIPFEETAGMCRELKKARARSGRKQDEPEREEDQRKSKPALRL